MREIPKGPSSADQQRASQANTSNSDSSSPSSASNIGVGSDGVQVGGELFNSTAGGEVLQTVKNLNINNTLNTGSVLQELTDKVSQGAVFKLTPKDFVSASNEPFGANVQSDLTAGLGSKGGEGVKLENVSGELRQAPLSGISPTDAAAGARS